MFQLTRSYIILFTMVDMLSWISCTFALDSENGNAGKGSIPGLIFIGLSLIFGPSLFIGWTVIGIMAFNAIRRKNSLVVLFIPVIAIPLLTALATYVISLFLKNRG